jgi:hypothetical protein
MLSDFVIMGAIAALPSTIAAIANFIVTVRNGNKADAKADAIHELVDVNMTAVKTDLKNANNKVGDLQVLVKDLADSFPRPFISNEEKLATSPPTVTIPPKENPK